jgi:hypothetical protein
VHVLEWLANTLDHLPPGISLFGLGVVRRYNSSRSRIILGGFELSAIVPFLKNLDWKGDLSDIAQITACLGHGSWFSLILDYTQKMEPDLGIECWFDPDGSETIIWETLEALRSIGIHIVDDPGLGLNNKLEYWGHRYWINHIKVKLTWKKKAEVKIYTFFMKKD